MIAKRKPLKSPKGSGLMTKHLLRQLTMRTMLENSSADNLKVELLPPLWRVVHSLEDYTSDSQGCVGSKHVYASELEIDYCGKGIGISIDLLKVVQWNKSTDSEGNQSTHVETFPLGDRTSEDKIIIAMFGTYPDSGAKGHYVPVYARGDSLPELPGASRRGR
jgi:hypothetical protein